MEPGEPGRFEVFADGQKIAERKRGLIARLLGGGWPDEGDVVRKVRAVSQGSSGA
jgi:predicted Rdx family selenoprotein